MAPADYAVHDVTVRDVPTFGSGGTITMKTQVTFFVGAHGPFQLSYGKDQATGAQIQSDIQKQVQVLRTITGEP
jgi:hypothetical protein